MPINPLWSFSEVVQAVNAKADLVNRKGPVIRGVSIDTRTIRSGDLFVALKGEGADGHRYIKSALKAGASGAIVSHCPEGVDPTQLIIVPDTMAALTALGRAGRARSSAKIVGVTGSVGKTGTKEALRAALGRFKPTHASVLSYNNDIGVPLTLARMPRDVDFGVLEMGMNHSGELTALSMLARPHIALITTIARAHIEFFDSIEAIADAKAEIFAGLAPGGTAILNHDNEQFARLKAAAADYGVENVISFGLDARADVRVLKHVQHELCSCITAEICGQTMTYKIGLPGRHWVLNSLGVLATVQAAGGDLGLAGLALGEMSAVAGRGQRMQVSLDEGTGARFIVIDESYNANPASMRAAIETLGQANIEQLVASSKGDVGRRRGRRIAVLGDMGELGKQSDALHAGLAKALGDAKIDLVYSVGPHMAHLDAALPAEKRGYHVATVAEMIEHLIGQVQTGDVIMVKGSKATGMGVVVEALLALDHGKNSNKAANG